MAGNIFKTVNDGGRYERTYCCMRADSDKTK